MEAILFAPIPFAIDPAWTRHSRKLLIGVVLFLAGCAGTKIGGVTSLAPTGPLHPPRTIAVIVENDSPAPQRISRQAAQREDAQAATAALAASLPKRMATHQLVLVPTSQPADLVLRCRILDVRAGSEALRMLVGYGAGRALLRVEVSLIDPRHPNGPPLLSFETNSTTGRMPGAGLGVASGVGSGNALAIAGSAMGVPGAMKRGLSQEVQQTTDHIDEELGTYFMAQNWPYTKPVPTSLGGWVGRF